MKMKKCWEGGIEKIGCYRPPDGLQQLTYVTKLLAALATIATIATQALTLPPPNSPLTLNADFSKER